MADSAGFLILGALAALVLVQGLNLREFRRISPRASELAARTSILIPARDEERNIERCVRSVASQQSLEVLVLDDGSTDRTAEILRSLQKEYSHVRAIDGQPLPAGWRGKNWACHQLATQAKGDYLLFTDADTEHHGSVGDSPADLLSLMPRQIMVSKAERFFMPLLNFVFVTFFPAFMLRRSRSPRFSAANGQFMLFRRAAYETIGGHESIRGSIVDDLALAKRIREAGLVLVTGDGQDVVSCRMYQSGREIVDGFSKNFYTAVGRTPVAVLSVTVLLAALFVAPVVMAIAAPNPVWITAALVGVFLRFRSGDRSLWALLHFASIVAAIAILWRSMVVTPKGAVSWKGRPVSEV